MYIYIYIIIYIYILDIMDNHHLLWFTRGDHVPHLLVPFPRRRRPSFPGSPAAQCAPATKSPLAPPRRTRCSSRHWIVTRRSSWEIYGENVGKCSIIHIKHGWNMLKFWFVVFITWNHVVCHDISWLNHDQHSDFRVETHVCDSENENCWNHNWNPGRSRYNILYDI